MLVQLNIPVAFSKTSRLSSLKKKVSSNIDHGQNKRGPKCTRYSFIHAIGNYQSSRNFSNLHVSEIFVSPVSFSFDGLHISILSETSY